MRTIETRVYQFNELSEDAREKALDECRYYSVLDGFWHDFVELNIIDYAREKGICNVKEIRGFSLECAPYCKLGISSWIREFNDEETEDDEKENVYNELCEHALDLLRKEYEWLISDESVKDFIISNGYEFTEEGKRL